MSGIANGSANNPSWLANLLSSSNYSDIVIRCGGRDFNVHKAVICMQSEFFEAACKGGFQEAEEGVINLEEDDPAIIEAMLQFLYLGRYDRAGLTSFSNLSAVEFSAHLYCVGDKYQIQPLKVFVQKEFAMVAIASVKDVAFKDVISYVYANTVPQDRPLRHVLVCVTLEHFDGVFNGHGEELKSIPEFMFDLSTILMKVSSSKSTHISVLKKTLEDEQAAHKMLAKYRCSSCLMQFTMSERVLKELRCPRRTCPRLSVLAVDEFRQVSNET